ncbi:MAG: class I SAM-dependent methyltransferase [Candidatus Saganbacteria bacterium]|nr:class I SAM-dependent methyltransferase [Candidatus Saganbacteria bacterium]
MEKPWDRAAEERGVLGRIMIDQRRLTVQALGKRPPGIIVDLGCGTGAIINDMKSLPGVKGVIALDINKQALVLAMQRAHVPGHDLRPLYLNLDMWRIKFPVNRFDTAVCLDVLSEMPEVPAALSIIHNLVKPGGTVVGNFVAREKANQLFIRKYGTFKFLQLKTMFMLGMLCSPSKKMFEYFGAKGHVRLMPYSRSEVETFLSRYFCNINIVSGYYHWFCAENKK